MNRAVLDGMLGFTGGVMVAASFWSLLSPAIEMSKGDGFIKVIPAAIGFFLGALFLFGLDKVLPHLHVNFNTDEAEGVKTPWHRTTLLVLAITLHNIPEGLAVGVLFGGVAAGFDGATIGGAVALAIGIGLQNFPEGFAVAMPMMGCYNISTNFTIRISFCSWSNDFCSCRRSNTRNTAR